MIFLCIICFKWIFIKSSELQVCFIQLLENIYHIYLVYKAGPHCQRTSWIRFKLRFGKTFYFIYLNTHGNSHQSGCINTLKGKVQRLAQVCCAGGTSFRASLVAQSVKIPPAMQEIQVWSLGQEDPLEKEMGSHPSILAWRILWPEEPGRLQSMGSHELELAWWLHHHHYKGLP